MIWINTTLILPFSLMTLCGVELMNTFIIRCFYPVKPWYQINNYDDDFHYHQIIRAFVVVIFYSSATITQLLHIASVLPKRCLRMKGKAHDRKIWVTCDIFTLVLSPGVNSLQTGRRADQSRRLSCPCQPHFTGQAVRKESELRPAHFGRNKSIICI